MRNVFVIATMVLLTVSLIAQNIDTEKSVIGFHVSNMKVNKVFGTINGLSGEVFFEPDNLKVSYFNVSVDASMVDTRNRLRDEHLKDKEKLLFASKYPTIDFRSDKIEKTGDGYKAKGWLTIKDVKKQVEIPFKYGAKENVPAFFGSLTINRHDYKVGEGTNSFMIGDDVVIEILCVLDERPTNNVSLK